MRHDGKLYFCNEVCSELPFLQLLQEIEDLCISLNQFVVLKTLNQSTATLQICYSLQHLCMYRFGMFQHASSIALMGAMLQASSSNTPYPAGGLSTLAPSPHQYPTHTCNMSPQLPVTAAPAGPLEQLQHGVSQQHDSSQQHGSFQQHAIPSPAASGAAAGAHQLEAQWEAESLTAAQTASRLSLLQAEQTQIELELASAVQQADGQTGDAGLSHSRRQETAVPPAATAEDAACNDPSESIPIMPVQQKELHAASCNMTGSRHEEAAARVTQNESLRPAQPSRAGSRRMTRSSSCASVASQSSESDVVSTAHGRSRGRCQAQAMTNLPVVTEHSEANLAADSAVSTAEAGDHQEPISHAAADTAADREPVPSRSRHRLALDTALASVLEEEDWAAAPADPMLSPGNTQQNVVPSLDGLHDCEAALASASGAADAASAPSQEAARQTQRIKSAQHSVRLEASDAAQTSAPDSALLKATVAGNTAVVEANYQSCSRLDSAPEADSSAAQSQQAHKGRGRAKRPPKCRQAARKKHNRKQGRMPSGHDENADINTASATQHPSVHASDTAAAQHNSGNAALDCSTSSPVQAVHQKEVAANDQPSPAGKHGVGSKPPR